MKPLIGGACAEASSKLVRLANLLDSGRIPKKYQRGLKAIAGRFEYKVVDALPADAGQWRTLYHRTRIKR